MQDCEKLQEKKVSNNIRRIYEMLTQRIKFALTHDKIDIDHQAFFRKIQDLQTIERYVVKRQTNVVKLINIDFHRKMNDYAMIFCQTLKDVKSIIFKNVSWIIITEELNKENKIWDDWNNFDQIERKFNQSLHVALQMIMIKIKMFIYEHEFWIMRLYTKRNFIMHSNLFDKRLLEKYDEMLKKIETNLEALKQI